MTKESGRQLVLFAKEPEAGRVKTRLARTIGAEAAAALYAAFLEDLSSALRGDWEMVLAHDGDGGPRLRQIFKALWTFQPQGDGNLAERMSRAVAGAFTGDSSKVVIAGSDAPTLVGDDIAAAFSALENADMVFAPSPDGGYSLVGIRRNPSGDSSKVFGGGIRWSTAHALEDTEAAAKRLGLRIARIAPVPDIDLFEDLEALAGLLRLRPDLAPFSKKILPGLLSSQQKNLSRGGA